MTVICRISGNWEPWLEAWCLELKYLRASWRGSGKIWGIGPSISHHLRNQGGIVLENFLLNIIIILVLIEQDFLKGVHIVIITIVEFWPFEVCEQLECRGLQPLILATNEACNYELVVKVYWGVPSVCDILHSSKLFLDEDALIELNVFLWVFWEEMPSFGQDFYI